MSPSKENSSSFTNGVQMINTNNLFPFPNHPSDADPKNAFDVEKALANRFVPRPSDVFEAFEVGPDDAAHTNAAEDKQA